MKLTVGVDPGVTGALAFLDPDGEIVHMEDMPPVTDAALGAAVAALLRDLAPDVVAVAWVESQVGMPGQSSATTARFHRDYGAVLGAFGALGVRVELVAPAKWKKAAGLSRDKGLSLSAAVRRWPAHAGLFKLKKHDGRAEAALIALHGQGQAS